MSIRTPFLLGSVLLVFLLLSGCGQNEADGDTPATTAEPTAAAADGFIGRIDAIDGNEITLTKAADEDLTNGGAAGGQGDAARTFTGDTLKVTVDESTQYAQYTTGKNEDGQAIGDTIGLADLEAGDMVKVTLTEDTLTAKRIELQIRQGGGGQAEQAPGATTGASPQPTPGASADTQPSPDAAGKNDSPANGQAGGKGTPPSGKPANGAGGTPPSGAPAGAAGAPPEGGASGGGSPGTPPSGAPAGGSPASGQAAGAKPLATAKATATAKASAAAQATATAKASAAAQATASPKASAASAPATVRPSGGPGGNAAAMSFGKIKSISGSAITVYMAEAAGPPQGGAAPSAAQSAPPSPTGSPVAGEATDRGAPQGGPRMSFTEETLALTMNSSTKLLSVTFKNGNRTETAIAVSGLKAGDIIQYVLKTDSTIAESISLSSGGAESGN